MKKLLVLICGLAIFSTACKHKMTNEEQEKYNWNKRVDSIVTHWQGRKLIVPDGMPVMTVDSSNFVNGKSTAHQKLVTYVDGTCGVCVTNLNHWRQFIREIRDNHGKCDFVFYIQAENKDDFKKEIMDTLNMGVTWMHDSKEQFIHVNNLTDPRFQTALLDDSDKVVLIGTMEDRHELRALYKKTILENSK